MKSAYLVEFLHKLRVYRLLHRRYFRLSVNSRADMVICLARAIEETSPHDAHCIAALSAFQQTRQPGICPAPALFDLRIAVKPALDVYPLFRRNNAIMQTYRQHMVADVGVLALVCLALSVKEAAVFPREILSRVGNVRAFLLKISVDFHIRADIYRASQQARKLAAVP